MKKTARWRLVWTTADIRRKLLITFGILVIYRFAAHVPVPGANRDAIQLVLEGGGAQATLVQIFNLLSGGTIANFSVLAMGVYPYITAQIILQVLAPIIPAWKARMEDDQREYRKWMERTTYFLAIPMSALQAFGQINIMNSFLTPYGIETIPGFGFGGDANILRSVTILITMTAGTMFAIWMGELISEYGIRNQGLSLIIFAGIISQIIPNFARIFGSVPPESQIFIITFMAILTLLTIFVIVIVQQGRRNVRVMYPGRRMGRSMSMPVKGELPLMVNMAGMIPLIFGQAVLSFPAILGSLFINSETPWIASTANWVQLNFGGGSNLYFVLYFLMVVLFTFFYTNVIFQQQNYGENLKRQGARVQGVTPGAPTQRYLQKVLSRITLPGAVFLGIIAIMPFLVTLLVPSLGAGGQTGTLLVSSSGLLIVVGVVRDTFFNIDAELKLHGYDESLLVK